MMTDELRQAMQPVDYEAVVTATIEEIPVAPLERLIGRAMQLSHGAANPATLRTLFELIENGAEELKRRLLDELAHPSDSNQIGGLQLAIAANQPKT